MKYKWIIFDLDGVICHTDMFHFKAWKAIADRLGIYFDETINNRLRGVGRMESLAIVLERYSGPALSKDEQEKLACEKNVIYKSLLSQMDESYVPAEVLGALCVLREKGIKMAIGSSSKNAKYILKQIGLNNFFDAISDGNNIQHTKPHPQVFTLAAQYLYLPPSSCLVVEDARAGIEAAVAGGFDSAGIGDAARDARATYAIESLHDLINIVGVGLPLPIRRLE